MPQLLGYSNPFGSTQLDLLLSIPPPYFHRHCQAPGPKTPASVCRPSQDLGTALRLDRWLFGRNWQKCWQGTRLLAPNRVARCCFRRLLGSVRHCRPELIMKRPDLLLQLLLIVCLRFLLLLTRPIFRSPSSFSFGSWWRCSPPSRPALTHLGLSRQSWNSHSPFDLSWRIISRSETSLSILHLQRDPTKSPTPTIKIEFWVIKTRLLSYFVAALRNCFPGLDFNCFAPDCYLLACHRIYFSFYSPRRLATRATFSIEPFAASSIISFLRLKTHPYFPRHFCCQVSPWSCYYPRNFQDCTWYSDFRRARFNRPLPQSPWTAR